MGLSRHYPLVADYPSWFYWSAGHVVIFYSFQFLLFFLRRLVCVPPVPPNLVTGIAVCATSVSLAPIAFSSPSGSRTSVASWCVWVTHAQTSRSVMMIISHHTRLPSLTVCAFILVWPNLATLSFLSSPTSIAVFPATFMPPHEPAFTAISHVSAISSSAAAASTAFYASETTSYHPTFYHYSCLTISTPLPINCHNFALCLWCHHLSDLCSILAMSSSLTTCPKLLLGFF